MVGKLKVTSFYPINTEITTKMRTGGGGENPRGNLQIKNSDFKAKNALAWPQTAQLSDKMACGKTFQKRQWQAISILWPKLHADACEVIRSQV